MSANFHRDEYPTDLWYPSLIEPLDSSTGHELFSNSFHGIYNQVYRHFQYQEQLSYCGLACAVTLLNVLLPERKSTQSILYSTLAKNYMSNGITLSNLATILDICELSCEIHFCKDEEKLVNILREENHFVIVNYWRQYYIAERDYIHQGGHFAIIAGWNPKTDQVLLLDPNEKRFPHHWLSFKHLIRMMSTYDQMAASFRGYLIISKRR